MVCRFKCGPLLNVLVCIALELRLLQNITSPSTNGSIYQRLLALGMGNNDPESLTITVGALSRQVLRALDRGVLNTITYYNSNTLM